MAKKEDKSIPVIVVTNVKGVSSSRQVEYQVSDGKLVPDVSDSGVKQ